jgi:stage V sporulation protein SpoVS
MPSAVRLSPEAQEVALAEAQAVRALASDEGYRERLGALVGAASEGEVGEEDAQTLEELLELGLQSGRIRALYGPGGEQAALSLYRRLPRGAELVESAREVSAALDALAGRELGSVELRAVGPGAFTLSLSAGELELSLRLDRQGARLSSVGV